MLNLVLDGSMYVSDWVNGWNGEEKDVSTGSSTRSRSIAKLFCRQYAILQRGLKQGSDENLRSGYHIQIVEFRLEAHGISHREKQSIHSLMRLGKNKRRNLVASTPSGDLADRETPTEYELSRYGNWLIC